MHNEHMQLRVDRDMTDGVTVKMPAPQVEGRDMSAPASGRPPFRADHLGSLLRPARLRQAFREHLCGKLNDDEFASIEDDCIRQVVGMQEAIGLPVVTDGEFRRGSYWGRFVERTEGFVTKPAMFKFRDDSGRLAEFRAPYAERKVKRTQSLALDEFSFLRRVAKATPKVTLPAPSTMHFYGLADYAARDAYSNTEDFFADLVAVFRQEIADLGKAGGAYLQFDEVAIAMLCDPSIRAIVQSAGYDPNWLVNLYLDALNDCASAVPSQMAVGVHLCRGNFRGRYLAEGGYDWVAQRLFQKTNVRHFLLEYDTVRSGDFAPLRFVPQEKGVVLGLVSSKIPDLERVDDLIRRIDEATHFIGLEQLAISPQCGFASTTAGNPLTEVDEQAKLRLVVDVAEKVWGSVTAA
jgi:5-methyltetrahydropteroyltriglutamate--homocysteine methyltransferase